MRKPIVGSWLSTVAGLLVLADSAWAVEMSTDRRAPGSGGFGATGAVTCGSGSGTAQLVGSQSVIVTAAHVLFGQSGLRSQNCTFNLLVNGQLQSYRIDTSRVRAGTTRPYADPASLDWAVARLEKPVSGVRPYLMGGSPSAGQPVRLISGRTLPSSMAATVEACAVRGMRSAVGGNEAMLDCSAQAGDSGAAVLAGDGRVVAVYVGFRSMTPGSRQPFSDKHYNFAVTLAGPLRAAVSSLSR